MATEVDVTFFSFNFYIILLSILRLREMCALYVEHADLANIYHKYINDTLQLADLLCRFLCKHFIKHFFMNFFCSGEGVFRDCYNLQYHPVIVAEKDEYNCKSLGICGDDCKFS